MRYTPTFTKCNFQISILKHQIAVILLWYYILNYIKTRAIFMCLSFSLHVWHCSSTICQRSVNPSNLRRPRPTYLRKVNNEPVFVLYWMKSVFCESSKTKELVL